MSPMVHPATTPFLRIPYELRAQIYDLAVGGQTVHIRESPVSHPCDGYQTRHSLCSSLGVPAQTDVISLLLCSRQVYAESRLIYFTHNRFTFASMNALLNFSNRLLCDQAAALRNVVLHYRLFCPFALYSAYESTYSTPLSRGIRRMKGIRNLQVLFELSSSAFLSTEDMPCWFDDQPVAGVHDGWSGQIMPLLAFRACHIRFVEVIYYRTAPITLDDEVSIRFDGVALNRARETEDAVKGVENHA